MAVCDAWLGPWRCMCSCKEDITSCQIEANRCYDMRASMLHFAQTTAEQYHICIAHRAERHTVPWSINLMPQSRHTLPLALRQLARCSLPCRGRSSNYWFPVVCLPRCMGPCQRSNEPALDRNEVHDMAAHSSCQSMVAHVWQLAWKCSRAAA
jgi:hypothetical protein